MEGIKTISTFKLFNKGLADKRVILVTNGPDGSIWAGTESAGVGILNDDQFKMVIDADGLFLVTHDLGIVAQYCDVTFVMYKGEIVENGTVHEIFKNPRDPYTIQLIKASSEEIS